MDINFKVLADFVKKSAPFLASVISETNPIAGLILMALAKKFDTSSDPNDIMNALQKDPLSNQKLHELELEHQNVLMEYQVNNVEDARKREESIITLTGKRDWILDFLSITVVVSFFIICILNYFLKVEDDHIVTLLIGQISGAYLMVLSYYFGSSNTK